MNNVQKHNVTYRSIVRQRLGKHISAHAYARHNRMFIAKQRVSKQVFSKIEAVFSA
jgi:hypothetical protein